MKTNIFSCLLLSAALALTFSSCAKEDPFAPSVQNEAMGTLSFKKLLVRVDNKETTVRGASLDDVNVSILKDGTEVYSQRYAELPEVLSLEAGDYTVLASLGDNPDAGWDAPYYEGSGEFTVKPHEITDVEEIVCSLANIKVTIIYDKSLLDKITGDAAVQVVCGNIGSLSFATTESRSGNFRYVEGSSTLVATFSGSVDGENETHNKQYNDVLPGKHYKITYSYHDEVPGFTGTLEPNFRIDATVEVEDLTFTINAEEPPVIDDDSRPVEGEETVTPPDPGPGIPDTPVTPPAAKAPEVTCENPAVVFGSPIQITADLTCKLHIKSEAAGGIKEFMVNISSTNEMFTAAIMDMFPGGVINVADPSDSVAAVLASLPLAHGAEVKGQQDVDFDISAFIPLLNNDLFSGTHTFRLTITDANGTTVKDLMLKS